MSREETSQTRLPRGVTLLPRSRGGRRFLSKIRQKGVEIHLGIYESAGLAGFAFNVASEAIGRGSRPPNPIPDDEQPDAETVWRITGRVRRRLGLDRETRRLEVASPDPEQLLVFFEVTVVGFWRDQAARSDTGQGVDVASRRLVHDAQLVFGGSTKNSLTPDEAIARLVARRVDRAFRRADLTRAILDDDGDEDWRVARWLVLPDHHPQGRGFRDEVRYLYPELFEAEPGPNHGVPHWACVLAVDPPFSLDKIRDAYRTRSKTLHPDVGGTHVEFVRLRAAYEEARDYCRVMGL